jgi:hypothetical protein
MKKRIVKSFRDESYYAVFVMLAAKNDVGLFILMKTHWVHSSSKKRTARGVDLQVREGKSIM